MSTKITKGGVTQGNFYGPAYSEIFHIWCISLYEKEKDIFVQFHLLSKLILLLTRLMVAIETHE